MARMQSASLRSAGIALERHISGRKVIQSDGNAWVDVEVQIFERASAQAEILVPAVAEPLLVWVVAGDAVIEERELDGDWRGTAVTAGAFFLTQAQSPYLMRWTAKPEQRFEVMHLYIGLELLGRAALSLGLNPTQTRLRDVSGVCDARVSRILEGINDEVRAAHAANRMFAMGLVESLVIHLLRSHAQTGEAGRTRGEQLSASNLRRALNHMEANLAAPFDLDVLAALCSMSRYHFSRAFHNTMAKSPSRWLIQRRMTRAREMLRATDQKILEIAASVGYDSPSHFAKIFREETGVGPREYRGISDV